ncbi:MAG: glycosyltransferase family 39 protein [Blastocatellia bacterium]
MKKRSTDNSHVPLATEDPRNWKRDFYLWLPLACLSWWLAWKYQDEFISDWDGFDYTAYTVQHLPSALGLGRALFLGYNYLLWEVAHRFLAVPPEHAYLVLRYGVIAQTGPAIVGMYALCKELTSSRFAATLGALLAAASPYFIIYSGRAMSEIPGYLALGWSLWWMLRSLRRGNAAGFLLAAALVGLSANIREFAVFYLPFILIAARIFGTSWRLAISGLAIGFIGAFAGMIFWTWFDTNNYIRAVVNWWTLSAQERKLNPVTSSNLRFFADYAFNCSAAVAITAPLAFIWLWSYRRLPALLWLGLFGLLADVVLIANHDLSVNPRYMLTGLFGLAPACGWCIAELIKRYRARAIPLLVGFVLLTKGSYNHTAKELYEEQWASRAARNYFAKIEDLPWNSGFIVGARTPLIHFFAGVGARPYWRTISPGAGWPDEKLDQTIRDFFYAGRLVYVDFDPELWQTGARETSREADGLERVKQTYRLQHIRDSFYRVVERLPRQTNDDAARNKDPCSQRRLSDLYSTNEHVRAGYFTGS